MANSQWRVSFSNGDEYVGGIVAATSAERHVLPHGEGTYKYHNGDVYTGAFVSGLRCGAGLAIFANGERFAGQWADDAISLLGKGTLTLADGTTHEYT